MLSLTKRMENRLTVVHAALRFALVFVAFASVTSAASAAGTRVTVPNGTLVEIAPVMMLGSLFNPKGSTFEAVVKKDVIVNGFVIVKAGAKAQGTIVDSVSGDAMRILPQEPTGPTAVVHGFTIEGKEIKGSPLEIRFDWAVGVDGLKLALGDITTDGDSNGNSAQTTPSPSYLLQTVTKMKKRSLLFNFNSTYKYDVKAGAGTIPPSQVFEARIKGPVHTVTSLKAGDVSNDGFAH